MTPELVAWVENHHNKLVDKEARLQKRVVGLRRWVWGFHVSLILASVAMAVLLLLTGGWVGKATAALFVVPLLFGLENMLRGLLVTRRVLRESHENITASTMNLNSLKSCTKEPT